MSLNPKKLDKHYRFHQNTRRDHKRMARKKMRQAARRLGEDAPKRVTKGYVA